jgi:hypothetical protein
MPGAACTKTMHGLLHCQHVLMIEVLLVASLVLCCGVLPVAQMVSYICPTCAFVQSSPSFALPSLCTALTQACL